MLVSVQNLATGHLAGASAEALRTAARRSGPSGAYTFTFPPLEGVGSVVLRACGGSRPSILWLLGASRQGWYLPAVSGDLNVTSCMTPKVRFLDGVVCVLLCVGLNPCRLHVVLLRRATCRICGRDVIALMKVV